MKIGEPTKIDETGRIVIPKNYRALYNFKKGENVYVIGTEDGVLISKLGYKLVEVTEPQKD